jgi:hypothetical protein
VQHPGEWEGEGVVRTVPAAPAMWIAASIQLGSVAALAKMPLLAAGLWAASAALLTIYAISTGAIDSEQPRNLPQAAFGVALTLLLASGLTVGGLSGRVLRNRSFAGGGGAAPDPSAGLVENARAMLRSLMYGEKPPGGDVGKGPSAPRVYDTGQFPAGSFPGVILTSEVRPVPLLVTPRPTQFEGAWTARSFAIPFDGEYWIYRYLYRKPPPNSYHRKGSPAALSFSTTDRWPLMMEAHQKFDQAIDLRCCRAVRIEIWNADTHPGTLSLELTAIDGDSGAGTLLGTVPVRSSPDLSKEKVTAVPETLEFAVPPNVIQNCTEFKMVFRRAKNLDRSARVAIDRFVLVSLVA